MKKAIIFLLLTLFSVPAFAQSPDVDNYLSPLTQRYSPKVKQCIQDNSFVYISKERNRNNYTYLWPQVGWTISNEFKTKLEKALNTSPYYYALRDCNSYLETTAYNYLTGFKKIKGKAQAVIREYQGQASGSSFYSNTLGANVFVVDARDVINGVGEGQEYILRIGQGWEKKLMTIAKKMNEWNPFQDDGITSPWMTKVAFIFTKYLGIFQPDNQAAKIGNSYYIAVK